MATVFFIKCSTSLSIQANQNTFEVSFLSLSEWISSRKQMTTNAGDLWGEGDPYLLLLASKLTWPLWKSMQRFLRSKIGFHMTHLGIYTEESTLLQRENCTLTFKLLYSHSRQWNQPRYHQPTSGQRNCSTYTQ